MKMIFNFKTTPNQTIRLYKGNFQICNYFPKILPSCTLSQGTTSRWSPKEGTKAKMRKKEDM